MSDDDLERFTYFGSFGDDPFIGPIPGRTNIVAVKRNADEKVPIFADNWHTDWSFSREASSWNVFIWDYNSIRGR